MGLLAPLAIAGGSGLLNALLGEEDRFDMSPEQRRMFNMLLREYEQGEFGPSPTQQAGMLSQFKGELQEESQAKTGQAFSSLARRGQVAPGILGGTATGIQSAYGKAYGRGAERIKLGSADIASEEKGRVGGLLAGLSQGQFIPGGDVPGLGGLGQNAMLAYLMRDQGQGQDKVSLQDLVRYFGGGR